MMKTSSGRTVIAAMIVASASWSQAAPRPSAVELYNDGQAAFNDKDYATAITKWQASYDLSLESELLFNISQAKRLAGDCVGALAMYRRFTTTPEPSAQKQLADYWTRELDEQCGKQAVVTVPHAIPSSGPQVHEDAHRDGHPGLRIAGLATVGAGTLTLVAGLALGHHAQTIAQEASAACKPMAPCDWEMWKSKDAAGRRDATMGRVLDVVGLAGIAGGAVMYYLGVRDSVAVSTSRESAIVSVKGSW